MGWYWFHRKLTNKISFEMSEFWQHRIEETASSLSATEIYSAFGASIKRNKMDGALPKSTHHVQGYSSVQVGAEYDC